ncbi:hypothetical protein D3C84_733400 [compost metagenome]
MSGGRQLLGIDAHKCRIANGGQHFTGVDLADDTGFASDLAFDFGAQGQRQSHGCRFDELDAQVAGDAIDPRQAGGIPLFGAVVVRHRRPVGVAVDQHRD